MAKTTLTETLLFLHTMSSRTASWSPALSMTGRCRYYRLAAEQAYLTSLKDATQRRDENSLEVLKGVRAQLDELNDFRKEDMAAEQEDEG